MDKKLEILYDFDNLVEKKFNNGIGEYIENIKKQHGLTDEDIAFFVNQSYTETDPYKLEYLTGIQVMRLIELCSDSDEMKSVLDAYKASKPETVECKIKKLLDLLEVNDEASLDKVLSSMQETKNGDKCACQHKEPKDKETSQCQPTDDKKKCCSHKCSKPKGRGRMSYSYYDSETMDKPEKESVNFEFEPHEYQFKNWKDIENLLLDLTKLF